MYSKSAICKLVALSKVYRYFKSIALFFFNKLKYVYDKIGICFHLSIEKIWNTTTIPKKSIQQTFSNFYLTGNFCKLRVLPIISCLFNHQLVNLKNLE